MPSREHYELAKEQGDEATATIPYVSREPIQGWVFKDSFFFILNGEPVAVQKETVGPLKYTAAVFQSYVRGR